MKRKYIVVNSLTGGLAFHGRKFWTAKGAIRKMKTVPRIFSQFFELRKYY